MKFLFSTSEGFEAIQQKPFNSIGGYPSITGVPNGKFNSIWGDISEMMYNDTEPTFICLFLKNITANTISGATFWLELPANCYSGFEVAVVVPEEDVEFNPYVERVDSLHSQPFTVEFYPMTGIDDALTLPDIAANEYLGIWFKRTVSKQAAIDEYNASITKTGDVYVQGDLSKEDSISLKVNW